MDIMIERKKRFNEIYKTISNITDDSERYEIIHRVFELVRVENVNIKYKYKSGWKETRAKKINILTPNWNLNEETRMLPKDFLVYYLPFNGKNSGIVINEKTKEDPDTMTLSYNGKQSAIRMGKEGFHISSDQAIYINVSGGEQIELGGQSAKHVAGAYNLSIDGVVNIYSKGTITISTDGDMNFTAKGNINFQCDGNFNVAAKGMIATKSTGETAINSIGKMSLDSADDLHIKTNSNVLFGGNGSVGMKSGGPVNIKGSTVNINGSGGNDPSPTIIPDFNIPAAAPTKPNVPKV